MHTTTDIDPIDELDITEGWQAGRHVWFVSDGRVIPFISGGDGSDDGLSDDDRAALEALSDDEVAALDGLSDEDLDELEELSDEDLEKLTGGKGTDWEAEAKKWKRLARKHEQRNKKSRRKGGAPSGGQRGSGGSGSGGDGDDVDVDAIRQEVLGEARKEFAERSVEVFLDAQVEAGRLSDDQADVLLESIDPTKFIDEDGDVDTDKVKALIEGIAKPATGDGNGKKREFPDTGQGRRNGSRRRKEKSSSVSAGRELHQERHGKKSTQSN